MLRSNCTNGILGNVSVVSSTDAWLVLSGLNKDIFTNSSNKYLTYDWIHFPLLELNKYNSSSSKIANKVFYTLDPESLTQFSGY